MSMNQLLNTTKLCRLVSYKIPLELLICILVWLTIFWQEEIGIFFTKDGVGIANFSVQKNKKKIFPKNLTKEISLVCQPNDF